MPTPLPVITNGFKLANHYHSDDATFVNTYWCRTADPSDAAQVGADFIVAYDNVSLAPTMRSLHSEDITFDQVEVTPLDGSSPTVSVARSPGVAGLGVSPMAAAQAALIITWETGIRGRNRRGRSFLAGVPNASLESGGARWGTAIIADALDWVQNFINVLADSSASPITLLVVSQHSVAGPHNQAIFGFIPRTGVGTQRRRTERNNP